jgi:predicted metal-dependent peptidase
MDGLNGGILSKAKCKLLLKQPFFGVLALHLIERKMTSEIEKLVAVPTAGTDGRYLYVNPDWVNKLDIEEQKGLVAHEVLHVALGHVYPHRRGCRDPKKWNIAADYVINLLVKDAGMQLPEGGLIDEKYRDKCVEEVYNMLPDEGKSSGKGKGKMPQLPWEDLLPPSAGGKGDGKDGKGKGGDGDEPESGISIDPQQAEKEWKEHLVRAAFAAKMRGTLPAGIERLVDGVMNPKVPWYTLLEQFVNDVLRDDYDCQRYDRRYMGMNPSFYLPELYNEGCQVAVAIDTSGSIGEKEIADFLSEAMGILRSRNVTKIRIMACDAKVTLDETLSQWDELPKNYPGGGGTDFRPVFKRLKDSQPPAALIYLTDLYGTFPSQPPSFPVIWCTMTRDCDVPFGTKIRFDPEEGGYELEHADVGANVHQADVDDVEDDDV